MKLKPFDLASSLPFLAFKLRHIMADRPIHQVTKCLRKGPQLKSDRVGRAAFHFLRNLCARGTTVAVGVGHRYAVNLWGERAKGILVRHVLGGERHGQVGWPA